MVSFYIIIFGKSFKSPINDINFDIQKIVIVNSLVTLTTEKGLK